MLGAKVLLYSHVSVVSVASLEWQSSEYFHKAGWTSWSFFFFFFFFSIEVMSSGGGWSKSVVSKYGSLLSHKLSLLFMENCQLNSE